MKNFTLSQKEAAKQVYEPSGYEEEYRRIGGEIFQEKQKNEKIVWGVIGVITFLIFNLILSLLTKV